MLALTKTILSQYSVAHFNKYHENDLIDKGKVTNIDLLASAIKEGITQANPKEIIDKEVCLILPQSAFTFLRFEIPNDISERAVTSFVADKLRNTEGVSIDDTYYDFLTFTKENRTEAIVYAAAIEVIDQYIQTCKLLGLDVKSVVPETASYFKLFEKTLRAEKKENILYVYYNKKTSWGYLFDSFGLKSEKKYYFDEEIEAQLNETAKEIESENASLNRIILSGPLSNSVRQDHFTKSVGVWTNPLEKIISNFYADYVKMFIVGPQTELPYLDYDVCLGAFIFMTENKSFSLLSQSSGSKKANGKKLPSVSLSLPKIKKRDAIIFILAFAVSFAAIFFYPRISSTLQKGNPLTTIEKPSTTPTPIPPTTTPVPTVAKEELKIRVLNGAGVAGKASEVKDILTEEGYSEIVTDNADSFDYELTLINVKEEYEKAADTMVEDLSEYVTIKKSSVSTLDATDSADLELIIGEDFE